jgi:hypothetical protein
MERARRQEKGEQVMKRDEHGNPICKYCGCAFDGGMQFDEPRERCKACLELGAREVPDELDNNNYVNYEKNGELYCFTCHTKMTKVYHYGNDETLWVCPKCHPEDIPLTLDQIDDKWNERS